VAKQNYHARGTQHVLLDLAVVALLQVLEKYVGAFLLSQFLVENVLNYESSLIQ